MPTDEYSEYASLLNRFDSGVLSLPEFETEYFRLFKNDTRRFEKPLYEILNGVFTALDSHVEDGVKNYEFELTTGELIAELKGHRLALEHYLSSK